MKFRKKDKKNRQGSSKIVLSKIILNLKKQGGINACSNKCSKEKRKSKDKN
ncbi:MAG: hypothetical protein ABIH08_08005 [Candidatus Omnitrophota bacterium]